MILCETELTTRTKNNSTLLQERLIMRKKLLAGAILAALFSTTAIAETLTYSATVGAASGCTISNINTGVMVIDGMADELGTSGTGGSAGTFDVTASDNSFKAAAALDWNGITIAANSGGPVPVISQYTVNISGGNGVTVGEPAGVNGYMYRTQPVASGQSTITIGLDLAASIDWPDGTYTISQDILCVPQ